MYGKDSFKITDSLPCSQQPATGISDDNSTSKYVLVYG